MNKDLRDITEEWRAEGLDEEGIAARTKLMECSPSVDPHWELREHMFQIMEGKIKAIDWPWPQLTRLAPTLIPETVTVLVGSPGASKSFMLLQCMYHWLKNGVEVSMLALEGTRRRHLQRLLAQLEGNPNLTNYTWVEQNQQETIEAIDRFQDDITLVGNSITCSDSLGSVSRDHITDWLQKRAEKDERILIVDPITAAASSKRPWEDDQELICVAKNIAKNHRTSIILVSHPAKHGNTPDLSSMQGGASYARLTDGVIWVHAFDPEPRRVMTPCGSQEVEINRIFHLLKARDGPGQGKMIGFKFHGPEYCLQMAEQGLIVKEKK